MDSTQAQPVNNFDPCRFGIFRSFTVYGDAVGGGALISTRAWNTAVADGRPVGDCRVCGHHIVASPTEIVGQITWYSAICTNPQCRKEIASPGGEMLRRSSRHDEMPKGFWEGRPGVKRRTS